MTSRYNGYTNYETWAVNLWLSNDESIYHMIRDEIEEMIRNYDPDDKLQYQETYDYFEYGLGNWIADWAKELKDETIHDNFGVFNDLLTAAMDKVNWFEIASCWLKGYRDQIEKLG